MSSNVELMMAMITTLLNSDQRPKRQVETFNKLRKELKSPEDSTMDLEWALLAVTLVDMVAALHPEYIAAETVWSDIAQSIYSEADEELSQIDSFADIEAMGEMIAFNFVSSIEEYGDEF